MRFDATGRYVPLGRVHKTLDFDVTDETALPSWLVTNGTSPILTFANPSTSRGRLRMQTKSATPTSGDLAGVQTAFNMDFSQFEEVFFGVYSLATDSSSATDNRVALDCNSGGTAGFFLINNTTDPTTPGVTEARVYPNAAVDMDWQLALNGNMTRQKDVGVVIRPRTREFAVYTGDPLEGAGCIFYSKGVWVNPTATPLRFQLTTFSAAQRYADVSRVKLRLSAN